MSYPAMIGMGMIRGNLGFFLGGFSLGMGGPGMGMMKGDLLFRCERECTSSESMSVRLKVE